jgi:hypothetical protein
MLPGKEGSAMPRKTFAAVLVIFAVLALLSPGKAVAGPPEGVSGKMVFDEVADGLRKYRKETDPEKRFRRLDQLTKTHDPRVDIILGEMLSPISFPEIDIACAVILRHHFTRRTVSMNEFYGLPLSWWEKNEADLRRRAKQLPR